jgi:hypothetical protein
VGLAVGAAVGEAVGVGTGVGEAVGVGVSVALGGLGELDEPPQPVSCKVKRLIRIKPRSFMTSWLTCGRSSVAVLKLENCLAVAKRTAVALKLPIHHPART